MSLLQLIWKLNILLFFFGIRFKHIFLIFQSPPAPKENSDNNKKILKAQIEIVKHFIDEESLCYTEDTDQKS